MTDKPFQVRSENPTKDWTEDFSHENGNYACICHKCKAQFIGHKRRITCRECYREFGTRTPTPAAPQGAPETILLEKMEKARGGGEVVKLTKVETRLMLDMAIRAVELDAVFDMHWKAQMRGVERWREETGETLTLPDTADFTVWMLEKIRTSDARIAELEQHVADLIQASGQECACGYDNPTDVCLGHKPHLDKRIATARNEALEEAAEWHEGRAILCEKEVGKDAKGKQIYSEDALRHRWFAGNIRALKTPEGEG